ncbi:MAG TPA: hypothetical protein VH143_18120 [Kofleriaceae bacterium]|jgi:hypothetical protein|nr:hypothetical protein [Kofleriaceae bacterium]
MATWAARSVAELLSIAGDDARKCKERVVALRALVEVDAASAESVVLEWLDDVSWWWQPKREPLAYEAYQVGAALATKRCVERMTELIYAKMNDVDAMFRTLARVDSPFVAPAAIRQLTDTNIRRDVAHAHHIMSTILCARREVGDRSRIAEIAANVEALVAPTRLPDDNKAEWIARIRATTAQLLALP